MCQLSLRAIRRAVRADGHADRGANRHDTKRCEHTNRSGAPRRATRRHHRRAYKEAPERQTGQLIATRRTDYYNNLAE
jgi:hypothetical protein